MSKEILEEQEAQLDRESKKRVQANMEGVLNVLEEQVAGFADPSKADAQVVYNLMRQRIRVAYGELDLTPGQNLHALDNLENWYTGQGVKYPHPRTLTKQREFWLRRARE